MMGGSRQLKAVLLSAAFLAARCSSSPLGARKSSLALSPRSNPAFGRARETCPTVSPTATSAAHHRHGPRACRVFLWDVASACRYGICVRLLRDNLYEGLGGRKFVRIKPGSLLQSLYPCSDHSPNRCAICGFTFPEHLEEWWKPHLRSPFDAHLDCVRERGVIPPEEEEAGVKRARRRKKRRGGRESAPLSGSSRGGNGHLWPSSAKTLCFHRRYVQEVAPPLAEGQMLKKSGDDKDFDDEGYERRRESNIYYRVPKFRREAHGSFAATLLMFARAFVLDEIATLIWVQERDNVLLQREEDKKIIL